METVQHQPYACDLLFQPSIMNLMEHEQTHQLLLPEPSYDEEVLNCSLETAFASVSEREEFYPPETNSFMERLIQMETELGAQLGIYCSNLGDQARQENKTLPMEEDNNQSNVHPMLEKDNCLVDLLLIGAKAVEASNWPLASEVIARLTTSLSNQENEDNTFKNMVFYFTQGLRSALEFFDEPAPIQTLNVTNYCMLLEATPYIKFAQFTANQAILEATNGDHEVHVIDLDIMEGIQWPPLMVDLISRKDVSMKITAIVTDPQNTVLTKQTGRRLTEFADSIRLPFEFSCILMAKEEDFNRIVVGKGTVVANCITHQLHLPSKDLSFVKTFLNGASRIRMSLKMVVLVEEELFNFDRVPSLSFSEFFSDAFQHYTALSDSLAHSFSSTGSTLIEREIIGLRILDCVRKFPMGMEKKILWEVGFSTLKGLKPMPISPCNVSQAKLLVGLYGKGYWLQYENCRLSLSWNGRPLITTSVWVSTNM